ncbi:hypothetical protein ABZV92_06015 [Streptomyces rubiginosohelvolus]|uniref:hypothetical protein n=1 Tax=Streptomyces rubiginosohelvolus TaxID=67362 RepID=UPI0033B80322
MNATPAPDHVALRRPERTVSKRVPPPPAVDLPEAPPFGWIGDPEHLTHNELDEIARITGKSLDVLEVTRLWPYAAVAYARRLDRDRYPWSVAGDLPLDAVKVADETGADDDAQAEAEAEHAAAVAAAIEAGEQPPPAPDPV